MRTAAQAALRHVRGEFARHPWMAPGLAISGSMFLGSVLPDVIALARWVLR